MSPEAQRIAIAESVGIYLHDGDHAPSDYVFATDLPDYLNDLNAMHDAEKALTVQQWPRYREELRTAVLGVVYGSVSQWCKADLHATAAQRAEAYLRTIGKWVD